MTSLQQRLRFAADLLAHARQTVALTGAGISTPSGIPDFRSADTGLWAQEESLEAASLLAFRHTPEKFYRWFRPLAAQIWAAQPNAAHRALARMERTGYLQAVLTQNVDLLHQKAGSRQIVELHGSLSTLSCTRCFARYEAAGFLPAYLEEAQTPHCPDCGAVLKPDVVLFGEQLPQQAWLQAQEYARSCQVMIVAGSSLEVLPVAGLPMQALDRGAHLIIINRTPTYLDVRADVLFREDVAEVLPQMASLIMERTL